MSFIGTSLVKYVFCCFLFWWQGFFCDNVLEKLTALASAKINLKSRRCGSLVAAVQCSASMKWGLVHTGFVYGVCCSKCAMLFDLALGKVINARFRMESNKKGRIRRNTVTDYLLIVLSMALAIVLFHVWIPMSHNDEVLTRTQKSLENP